MSERAPAAIGQVPSAADVDAVAAQLGRAPAGDFAVAVRGPDGLPMVIANEPLLRDGTPMPTRYWLVDPDLRARISRLEAEGGVRESARTLPPHGIADAHRRYAAERDSLIAADWKGPRPTGGVGGTRVGVKCLHAHVAWWLAGGNDPVGDWAAQRLQLTRQSP